LSKGCIMPSIWKFFFWLKGICFALTFTPFTSALSHARTIGISSQTLQDAMSKMRLRTGHKYTEFLEAGDTVRCGKSHIHPEEKPLWQIKASFWFLKFRFSDGNASRNHYPNVCEPRKVMYGGTASESGRNIDFASSQYDGCV
jgi:hypothetical protein